MLKISGSSVSLRKRRKRKTNFCLKCAKQILAALLLIQALFVFIRNQGLVTDGKGAITTTAAVATHLRHRNFITVMLHTRSEYYHTRLLSCLDTWLDAKWPFHTLIFSVGQPISGLRYPVVAVTDSVRPGLPPHSPWGRCEPTIQSLVHVISLPYTSKWYLLVADNTYIHLLGLEELLLGVSFLSNSDTLSSALYVGDCSCSFPLAPEVDMCQAASMDCTALGNSSFSYACGGPGILLSRAAVKEVVILEQVKGLHRSHFDLMLGYAMASLAIPCIHQPQFVRRWEGKLETAAETSSSSSSSTTSSSLSRFKLMEQTQDDPTPKTGPWGFWSTGQKRGSRRSYSRADMQMDVNGSMGMDIRQKNKHAGRREESEWMKNRRGNEPLPCCLAHVPPFRMRSLHADLAGSHGLPLFKEEGYHSP